MSPTTDKPRPAAPPQEAESREKVNLPGLRKTAILMVRLGHEASAAVLRHLNEEEVELITKEVARLSTVPASHVESVLEEFHTLNVGQGYVLEGGIEYAKKLLTDAFGPETGVQIVERLVKSMSSDTANFDALQKIDPRQLAKLVYKEHPQIIALILSHLVPAQAAALLLALPEELRTDVVRRMANLEQLSPEIIAKIAVFIGRRLKALGEFSRQSYGGVRAVAEMLNRLDAGVSEQLLSEIGQGNATLSETIRNLMFVFADLQKFDKEEMKILVPRIDRKMLCMALKGVGPQLTGHFMQCLSERASQMLQEDMEALGPVKVKDVEAAQQHIIALVRQLQAEGALSTQSAASGGKYIM
ncbi:MAG TPA: flagellar motor switch protein FliG [Bryobacteraceae bacterium]|nr:flagellar motor switch protein FliG [Bryobacteraceae bacterium]